MSISDELKMIKEKYKPEHMEIEYTPCSMCKNDNTLKVCLECELCGRKFDHGVLVFDPVEDNAI